MMVCTSFRLWVIRIISSLNTMPSSFQSGTSSQKLIWDTWLMACWEARWENTKASSREFDAKRLAPCRPVQEHSPEAYRCLMLVQALLSTTMPPQL